MKYTHRYKKGHTNLQTDIDVSEHMTEQGLIVFVVRCREDVTETYNETFIVPFEKVSIALEAYRIEHDSPY